MVCINIINADVDHALDYDDKIENFTIDKLIDINLGIILGLFLNIKSIIAKCSNFGTILDIFIWG